MQINQIAPAMTAEFGDLISPDLNTRVLFMLSEAGEVAKAVAQATQFGTQPFVPTDNFREEMGDLLCDVALVAQAAGVDLEACLQETLEKLRRRKLERGDLSSGR
jgi:NTP pyrophosphatase (non-canonical NTP hydrolase)